MVFVVMGMLLCVAARAVVLGYVALEARRESREFWTPEGERLIAGVRSRGGEIRDRGEGLRQRAVTVGARGRTTELPPRTDVPS